MGTSGTQLVGVAVPTLRALRSAVASRSEAEDAVAAFREAGFSGGEDLYMAFTRWLSETVASSGKGDVGDLPIEEFSRQAARFFRDAGWGEISLSDDDNDGLAIVDIAECWEGMVASDESAAGCHLTTGMLAAFFGQIAGYPVAVMEAECSGGRGGACRFLLGNPEVMQWKWERLTAA